MPVLKPDSLEGKTGPGTRRSVTQNYIQIEIKEEEIGRQHQALLKGGGKCQETGRGAAREEVPGLGGTKCWFPF